MNNNAMTLIIFIFTKINNNNKNNKKKTEIALLLSSYSILAVLYLWEDPLLDPKLQNKWFRDIAAE